MRATIKPIKAQENYTYLSIIAFFGFLGFMLQPTAYTWGEQDMMPFFERFFNSNYLSEDFFTNTAAQKNPRWVYGYFIVALSWLTNLSWYTTLYILKLILCIVSPILYFKVVIALLRRYVGKPAMSWVAPVVLLFVVLMVFLDDFRDFFSIASWLNYTRAIQANSLALVFCFVAILCKERGSKSLIYLAFFFVSCLVHPVVGLFGIIFYSIFLLPAYKNEGRNILGIFITGISGMVCVKLAFGTGSELSTAAFIQYYVLDRHPWHYHVPYYELYVPDWKQYFLYINFLFAIPFCFALIRKRKKLLLLSGVSWICYSGAIAMQYIFIDVYPVKIIAYLGVSRFTSFGYWMLLILWGILLSRFFDKDKEFTFPSLTIKNFGFITLNLLIVGILFIDSPKETGYLKAKGLYDFIDKTPEDAIFITHSTKLNTNLRLIGRRGVLVGLEFPFVESAMAEYNDRFSRAYGSLQTQPNGTYFYRNLGPEDFVAMSKKYRLDYIVTENDFSNNLGEHIPVWKNREYRVYAVKNLR